MNSMAFHVPLCVNYVLPPWQFYSLVLYPYSISDYYNRMTHFHYFIRVIFCFSFSDGKSDLWKKIVEELSFRPHKFATVSTRRRDWTWIHNFFPFDYFACLHYYWTNQLWMFLSSARDSILSLIKIYKDSLYIASFHSEAFSHRIGFFSRLSFYNFFWHINTLFTYNL
jgi:hypothetical protein